MIKSDGFSLIELMIGIAIISILAGAFFITLDPLDKNRAANDSKVVNDIASLASAAHRYAAVSLGNFPSNTAAIQSAGEVLNVPTSPSGYSGYFWGAISSGCTTDCTAVHICGQVKSKKHVNSVSCSGAALPMWMYSSATQKSCVRCIDPASGEGNCAAAGDC